MPDAEMALAGIDVQCPLPLPLPSLDAQDTCLAPQMLRPQPSPPREGSTSSPPAAVCEEEGGEDGKEGWLEGKRGEGKKEG